MIDERQLITELELEIGETYNSDICYGLKRAIEIVEHRPLVGKWIPCSERLPEEEYDTVLAVTNKNHYSVFVYTKEHGFRTADIDMEGDVVAWMPLEPYKGE